MHNKNDNVKAILHSQVTKIQSLFIRDLDLIFSWVVWTLHYILATSTDVDLKLIDDQCDAYVTLAWHSTNYAQGKGLREYMRWKQKPRTVVTARCWRLTCLLMSAPAWVSHSTQWECPANAATCVGVCLKQLVALFTSHPICTKCTTHSSCVHRKTEHETKKKKLPVGKERIKYEIIFSE